MTRQTRSEISEARAAALAANHFTFTVSHPCKNGHNAPRYSSSGICVWCSIEHPIKTPKQERVVRMTRTGTRPIQLFQDTTTASLMATSRKRFAELTGRPVSQNLIYRAAMRALANYLSNTADQAEALSLIQ